MRIFGGILFVLGFLISLSIVGAIFGIPLMIIGVICMVVGSHRRTVITNVVQVSNVVPQQAQDEAPPMPEPRAIPVQTAIPQLQPMQNRLQNLAPLPSAAPVIDAEFREERRGHAYDRAKWDALVKYDPDIARIVVALQPYGQKYVDELAAAYLALNDKRYLGMIVQKIVADARQAQAAARSRAAP